MSATGLDPTTFGALQDRPIPTSGHAVRVRKARLADFNRLMEQDGIEAVIEALQKEQTKPTLSVEK